MYGGLLFTWLAVPHGGGVVCAALESEEHSGAEVWHDSLLVDHCVETATEGYPGQSGGTADPPPARPPGSAPARCTNGVFQWRPRWPGGRPGGRLSACRL